MKASAEESKQGESTPVPAANQNNAFSVELLRLYYEFLFPYNQMYNWLSYGHDPQKAASYKNIQSDFFLRREFSFTIENDIYIRYLSFQTKDEMEREIKKKQPHKIDIGAVYTAPPKDHNTVRASAFKPVERELVFDIDLTDYDEIRTACTPDMMWEKGSWQLMAIAIKTLDESLRVDFGFEHLLWVFSGRRGVHCWVCDSKARKLEDKERQSLVNYLSLITGSENSSERVPLTWPLHPVSMSLDSKSITRT